jgi:superfamily I DNA/RNA helicase
MSKFPHKKKDNSHIIKAAVKHNWSEYQKAIFRNVAKDTGHLIVEAYAGCSKTSSLIESFKYIPRGKKTIAFAFNKIIQEELRARAPSYIEAKTFHSAGLQAIKLRFGAVEIDDNKVFDLVKPQVPNEKDYDLINSICDTVAFCKYSLQDAPKQIDKIIDNQGVDLCELPRDQFISIVIKTLGQDKAQTNKIDFNDMCYLPFVYNLPLGYYDYVYVDEMQDLNKSQWVMAQKACNPNNGRMIVVGDPNQECYGFRMSDMSTLKGLKSLTDTKTLTLPISYRCPKSAIELAKCWVPDITCPDTAIEGNVQNITTNELYKFAKPGCFILSRTNAPLIKVCMNLIRNGVKANIRGRDVGKQLNYLIKKSKKKQIGAFLRWLETWKDEQVEFLKSKGFNIENVLDRFECLTNICDECSSLEEVSNKVDELFNDADENNMVICSSIHRSKGLERDDVFILKWTCKTWFDVMDPEYKPDQEANIVYIAGTRTKKNLYIVSKPI